MRWKWSWLRPEPPEIFLYVMVVFVLAWEWGLLMQVDAASTQLEQLNPDSGGVATASH